VVYGYGHNTIARHLRDLVVTEHGIADLRGKTDEEVAAAMLAVTDSAFQEELAERAKREGKLDPSFELDAVHRENHASGYESVLRELRQRGYFPAFPFGTELTGEELELGRALRALKQRMASVTGEVAALTAAATHGTPGDDVRPLLERMGLAEPEGVEQTLYARLLAAELRRQRET
jgi:hypothetical protein